jgi:sugar phosphate isomerase/epimerase
MGSMVGLPAGFVPRQNRKPCRRHRALRWQPDTLGGFDEASARIDALLVHVFQGNSLMISRRQILRGSGVAAALTVCPRPLWAIDPFSRPTPGRLRLSLAAYSLRSELAGTKEKSASMDLFGFVDYCRKLGLDGAELTSYYFPEIASLDANEFDPLFAYAGRLKRHCHLAGITVSAGAIRNDFTSTNEATLAASQAHVARWVQIYQRLGTEAIRIFAGNQPSSENWSQTLPRLVRQVESACRVAEANQMMLALENHGGVTATSKQLLEIVRAVESPAFGINFDSGNFRSTNDPYAEMVEIAPYAINAQLKVDISIAGVEQETDVERVVKILRDSGYSGWIALEYESSASPREAIPKWIERLQKAIDA